MVLGVVGALGGLVKTQLSSTKIDSRVFRFHYRWTTALLFGSTAFLAAMEYFGKPIQCLNVHKAIETYCWISGVYTLNTKTSSGVIKPYAAHGSNFFGLGVDRPSDEVTYHGYYQFIPVILFLQGCLFYLPHILWKMREGCHIKTLLQGLHFVKLDEETEERITKIARYIIASKGKNQSYFISYSLLEFLNFINVIVQIIFLDVIFESDFSDLGLTAISDQYVDVADRRDALIRIFPRITKCNFRQFGSSGTVENKDTICILPQNMLNEKIFIAIWFWFLILAIITGIHVAYSFIICLHKKVRVISFDLKGRISNRQDIVVMIEKLNNADYFLLSHLRRNLSYSIFEQLLSSMEKELNQSVDALPKYDTEIAMDTLDLKKRNLGFE